MPTRKFCEAVTPDGSPCQAAALPQSAFCYFHDESKAAERREAQARGGRQNRAKTLDPTAPDVKIACCGDLAPLLSRTINQVLKGQLDPRVANTVGYLVSIEMRVFEVRDLEARIDRLEEVIERHSQIPDLTIMGD